MCRSAYRLIIVTLFAVVSCTVITVYGHGRVMEPPARNTMWRFGFPAKANYEDSELFCGGIKVQWDDNDGKCGVCGDAFSGVRHHETGGKYAQNITTRTYSPGSEIDVVIDLVANHGGRFYFEMCWRNQTSEHETEQCFERLLLTNGSRHYDLDQASHLGIRVIPIALPAHRTCDKCVFRWHWKSGNNWGLCGKSDKGSEHEHHGHGGSEHGHEKKHEVGCGPQETYRNCADIAVNNDGSGVRGPPSLRGNDVDGQRWKKLMKRR